MAQGELVLVGDAVMRAMCLTAFVWRANAEAALWHEDDPAKLDTWRQAPAAIDRWIRGASLGSGLSPDEQRLMALDVGRWGRQDVLNGCWRGEALGVILWALGRFESVPPYDTEFVFWDVLHASFVPDTLQDALAKVRVRPTEQILNARDVAELWHWRRDETAMVREGIQHPPGWDADAMHKRVAHAAYASGDAPAPIDDDLSAFGKAYRALTDEEFMLATSIAIERHFGLNWLCGYSDSWDETPTDT